MITNFVGEDRFVNLFDGIPQEINEQFLAINNHFAKT